MLGKINAHRLRCDLIVADGLERAAIGRVDDKDDQRDANGGNDENAVVGREAGDLRQPKRAVRNAVERRGGDNDADDLCKAERRNGEIVAFELQDRRADERGKERADNAGGKQRCDDRQMEIGKPVGNAVKIVHAGACRCGDRENGVGISAERHKPRLTERKEPRETVAEVHGHRKQRIDRAELQNRAEHRRTRNKLAGADDDRRNAEKTDGGTDRFFLLTHAHTFSFSFSPNRPVGRTSSTRISTTNVKTSLNSE